ncbi:MAG: phosphate acetyltransferase [Deltaproteobacteria bacterium]|nr:phosphate acetyltransferase [Deltaproteobacteria bacterium]
MPRTLLVAPAGRNVGLTTVCLGLVRALDRQGVRVAFAKPIAARSDRSVPLVKLGAHLDPPAPILRQVADELLADGDDQTLMEHVVELCGKAAAGADVLIVEGMVPEAGMVYSQRVNAAMMKALDAELVLVASPLDREPAEIASAVAIAARGFGASSEAHVGCVLNRICVGPKGKEGQAGRCNCHGEGRPVESDAAPWRKALADEHIRLLGAVPCWSLLGAPRVKDVAKAFDATVVRSGDIDRRRVRHTVVCAMTVPNAIKSFKPGALLITPGDRSDIILAAGLAAQGGMPLAGLLLTGGFAPDDAVLGLCKPALDAGLPVLLVPDSSYEATAKVCNLDTEIPTDDGDRVELAASFVADRIDTAWIWSLAGSSRESRLSPPAFRHRLVEVARAANKRIVLPEGAEPRTVTAAATVAERGIARCVLLADPDEVWDVARKQGVRLGDGIEIYDPAKIAERYVEPLVERRRARGMTVARALEELHDPIMVGTMMMALGEADGLVSGAVHTTAHTIRPALQIIKTAANASLVSSVFFMCLPDQVVVFGDCAVNPNPSAEQLADIAIQSADSAKAFGIPPRVAMLSYSTGASGSGEDVDRVIHATRLAKELRPDLLIDGPLQYDAAVMPDVARQKAPHSQVAGRATVLIFPDLNTGNVTYKAVQRSANVVSIGPMLQGLAKPVNDLSRGCLVEDVVFTIALTAIQADQAPISEEVAAAQ